MSAVSEQQSGQKKILEPETSLAMSRFRPSGLTGRPSEMTGRHIESEIREYAD
jgi:hypothetical protein